MLALEMAASVPSLGLGCEEEAKPAEADWRRRDRPGGEKAEAAQGRFCYHFDWLWGFKHTGAAASSSLIGSVDGSGV